MRHTPSAFPGQIEQIPAVRFLFVLRSPASFHLSPRIKTVLYAHPIHFIGNNRALFGNFPWPCQPRTCCSLLKPAGGRQPSPLSFLQRLPSRLRLLRPTYSYPTFDKNSGESPHEVIVWRRGTSLSPLSQANRDTLVRIIFLFDSPLPIFEFHLEFTGFGPSGKERSQTC